MMILDVDPKQKRKKGAEYFERDEELTEEWVISHQAFLVEELRTKITKKFEKDNEKLVAEKKKPLPEKELKERMKAVKELEAKIKKENKSGKVEAEGRGPTVDKLEGQLKKIDDRIKNLEAQALDRDNNKEVALGTSKIVSSLVCLNSRSRQRLTLVSRTTSILGSVSSFRLRWVSLSSVCSRRLYARSSSGPSSPSATTQSGNSEDRLVRCACTQHGGIRPPLRNTIIHCHTLPMSPRHFTIDNISSVSV